MGNLATRGRSIGAVALLGLAAAACRAAPTPTLPSPPLPTPGEPQAVATLAQMRGPWSPVPFVVPPEIVAAADRACRPSITVTPEENIVLVDVRGARTLQVWFAGPSFTSSCADVIVRADGTLMPTGGGHGGGGDYCGGFGPGQVIDRELDLRLMDRQTNDLSGTVGITEDDVLIRSTVAGCAGTSLASVWIQGSTIQPVGATVSNGWFAAWMPGMWPEDGQVVGLGPGGEVLAQVPLFR